MDTHTLRSRIPTRIGDTDLVVFNFIRAESGWTARLSFMREERPDVDLVADGEIHIGETTYVVVHLEPPSEAKPDSAHVVLREKPPL